MEMVSKKVFAWALYDFGNSAFVTAIMVALFPVFFKSFFGESLGSQESTAYLGFANSTATFAVMLLAPLLGLLSDRSGDKKWWLFGFTLLGGLTTAFLAFSDASLPMLSLVLYVLASIGFFAGNIFYDAMLIDVTDEKSYEKASLVGYALGYLGGGLFFLLAVLFLQFGEGFGFSKSAAMNIVFVATGVWWVLFSLPLVLTIKEPFSKKPTTSLPASIASIGTTVLSITKKKNLFYFLLAYMFYIDGVDTIAKMAVDFGMSIGLRSGDLIVSLLVIQFVSFPATLFVYKLLVKFSPKHMIYGLIGIYMLVLLGAVFMHSSFEFFVLAFLIGLAQGGIQALSRSYYAHLIPKDEAAEYFGFYNMFGKFSTLFGPLLVALMALVSDEARYNLLPIFLLFLLGMFFLRKVKNV